MTMRLKPFTEIVWLVKCYSVVYVIIIVFDQLIRKKKKKKKKKNTFLFYLTAFVPFDHGTAINHQFCFIYLCIFYII